MELGQHERTRRSTLAQINVTPLVDVMLVLLIIFMVTAPMLEVGIDVNLPEVDKAPVITQNQEPLVVTVQKDGTISIGRSKVDTPEKLTPVLVQALEKRKEKDVLLEADRAVPYGRVVQVMAAVKRAGVQKLGMVSQEPSP